jgi:methionyl-tRNA formyltransferase
MVNNPNYIFFGSSRLSVIVLGNLIRLGLKPSLVICPIPQKAGRGLVLKDSELKAEAIKNNVEIKEVDKLDENLLSEIKKYKPDFLLVASFGKILPKSFLNINKNGVLNIHPSILPKYRGPSPIQYQIINDEKNIGVSIMKMDEMVDHGPLLAKQKITIDNWPIDYLELEKILAKAGAESFVGVINSYLLNPDNVLVQDDKEATFTKLITKNEGLINLEDDARKNYLKYLALKSSVGVYFMTEHKGKFMRVKISEVSFENNLFDIKKVVPEGRKEMSLSDFKKGLK